MAFVLWTAITVIGVRPVHRQPLQRSGKPCIRRLRISVSDFPDLTAAWRDVAVNPLASATVRRLGWAAAASVTT